MILKKLLENIEIQSISNESALDALDITSLCYDSRKVCEGSLFVCIKGTSVDGHKYINDVVQKGTTVVVVEDDISTPEEVTVIKVADTRLALALLSANWFNHPAKKLTTIGVTGTKGKTTTTYMIYEILKQAGKKTGLVGTIEVINGKEHIHSLNTTPESYLLQEYFADMVKNGCTHVVMEVSSQAFLMHRVAGILFDIGVFTNIEPDHIGPNEHKNFDDYLHCKSQLFKQCKTGILNSDSDHLKEILTGHTCEVITFGTDNVDNSDFIGSNSRLLKKGGSLGTSFIISGKSINSFEIDVNMPGAFSVHNALGAAAVCLTLGIDESSIKTALSSIRVNGRVEIMPVSDRFTVVIDYAHNAMGLTSLLTTLKVYKPGRLVCLFGCGGNRDRARRWEMGEVSSTYSDLTIITSDNPRFEKPLDIIDDILTGVRKAGGEYITIPDRNEAIRYSIQNAKDGDIIVIAGKGHEDYQEIQGVKHHMDDHETVMDVKRSIL